MQNTSHAVMSQRVEDKESRDDFPTPPWATRALIEHIVTKFGAVENQTCLEPACGVGHMNKVLLEYFETSSASDIHPYGYGEVANFLTTSHEAGSVDWVITNPPFNCAEKFVTKARTVARRGVAILARTGFLETQGRYERLFLPHRPAVVAQFVERVPMIKGRLDKRASTATAYAWIVWLNSDVSSTELAWIPPCRKALERVNDYEASLPRLNKTEC